MTDAVEKLCFILSMVLGFPRFSQTFSAFSENQKVDDCHEHVTHQEMIGPYITNTHFGVVLVRMDCDENQNC